MKDTLAYIIKLIIIFITIWAGMDWYYSWNPNETPVSYTPIIKWPWCAPLTIVGIFAILAISGDEEEYEEEEE